MSMYLDDVGGIITGDNDVLVFGAKSILKFSKYKHSTLLEFQLDEILLELKKRANKIYELYDKPNINEFTRE